MIPTGVDQSLGLCRGRETKRKGDVEVVLWERAGNIGQLLACSAQVLTEQVIAETYYVPVGLMGDAAMNTIQPFSLRNNTTRPTS